MYSVTTLLKANADTREFLRLIDYTTEETIPKNRDEQTVATEQTAVLKAKVDSCKATEEWARKEKAKATRQLEQTSTKASDNSYKTLCNISIKLKFKQKDAITR